MVGTKSFVFECRAGLSILSTFISSFDRSVSVIKSSNVCRDANEIHQNLTPFDSISPLRLLSPPPRSSCFEKWSAKDRGELNLEGSVLPSAVVIRTANWWFGTRPGSLEKCSTFVLVCGVKGTSRTNPERTARYRVASFDALCASLRQSFRCIAFNVSVRPICRCHRLEAISWTSIQAAN